MAFAPLDWLQNIGQNAYSWAGDNPLQALSLGTGAAGTAFGVWDAYRAQKQQEDRRKLAEQMMRMGPLAYAPNYSPQQLMAMYFRPASQFMAGQGITDGGAFRQNLADTAQKAEADRVQMANQIFQSRLGALGYGPTRQPTGNVAGFGSALQNIILQNRLAQMGGGIGAERYTYRNQAPSQPGATWGQGASQLYPQGSMAPTANMPEGPWASGSMYDMTKQPTELPGGW
jgi:hypothetical protein